MAHKLAFEHELIRGDMIEAIEFPHLANKYEVHGVPKTVINEEIEFEGAMPENMFVAQLTSVMKS